MSIVSDDICRNEVKPRVVGVVIMADGPGATGASENATGNCGVIARGAVTSHTPTKLRVGHTAWDTKVTCPRSYRSHGNACCLFGMVSHCLGLYIYMCLGRRCFS